MCATVCRVRKRPETTTVHQGSPRHAILLVFSVYITICAKGTWWTVQKIWIIRHVAPGPCKHRPNGYGCIVYSASPQTQIHLKRQCSKTIRVKVCTLDTSQLDKSWLNDSAPSNKPCMLSTMDVSQPEMSWVNDSALSNMAYMAWTFHMDNGWSKDVAL